MKASDTVKITKCTNSEYVGFVGELYTNLQCFHANIAILSIVEIMAIDKYATCIGIISKDENEKMFNYVLWTRYSDFHIEIEKV